MQTRKHPDTMAVPGIWSPGPYIRAFLRPVASLADLPGLLRRSGLRVVPVFYHAVAPNTLPYLRHLYAHPKPERFRNHLALLLKYMEPVSLDDLIKNRFPSSGKPVFHLSFDDGLRCVVEYALPILKELGVPATLFVNPDFVGNKDIFYRYKASLLLNHISMRPSQTKLWEIAEYLNTKADRESLKEAILEIPYSERHRIDELAQIAWLDYEAQIAELQPYASEAELKLWLDNGFSLGAHSMDHPDYRQLSRATQLQQTIDSLDWVQKRFNLDYRAFAFPFTDSGMPVSLFDSLAHHDRPPDILFGSGGLNQEHHPGHYQRIPAEQLRGNLGKALKTELLYFKLKKRIGREYNRR